MIQWPQHYMGYDKYTAVDIDRMASNNSGLIVTGSVRYHRQRY